MKRVLCPLLVVPVLFCQSCLTSKLWEDTNPNERLWIDADDITEAELQQRGVRYDAVVNEDLHGYLVEKTAKQKLKDHMYRAFGTPFTVTVDAASTFLVVGALVWLHDAGHPGGPPHGGPHGAAPPPPGPGHP